MVSKAQRHGLRIQLGRWCQAGKLTKLRRGLYAINAPYRHGAPACPIEFFQKIHPGAWVSAETALSYYGVIPDTAFQIAAYGVNVKPRWEYFETEAGRRLIQFRRAPLAHAFGCQYFEIGRDQPKRYLFAEPEKALLDWMYDFEDDCLHDGFINELRLDYLLIDKDKLIRYADRFNGNRMPAFASKISVEIDAEHEWERANQRKWA